MADGLVCDRCGEGLLLNDNVRYTLNIEIRSEYDPMEITSGDLEQDFAQGYRDALEELEGMTAEDAQRSVYFKEKYDLCAKCQKEFLQDPVFKRPQSSE